MRRLVWSVPVLLVMGLVVASSLSSAPPEARAQTTPPPVVEIHRVQEADHVPPRNKGGPIFILALGSDARPGEDVARQRADAIQLIGFNPEKNAGGIIGFPRDSYVTIPGAGQRRINEGLFYGGPKLMVKTVQEVTGIKIDYYLLTSFPEFRRLTKGFDGVTVEIEYPMRDEASGTNFKRGERRLSGEKALAFTRDRHSPPGGDFGRSANQGKFLAAALAELQNDFAEDPGVLLKWIRAGMRNVQTDLSLLEVFDLATAAIQVDPKKVKTAVPPGGTGDVAGASVVFLSDGARSLYRDLKDDGILQG